MPKHRQTERESSTKKTKRVYSQNANFRRHFNVDKGKANYFFFCSFFLSFLPARLPSQSVNSETENEKKKLMKTKKKEKEEDKDKDKDEKQN